MINATSYTPLESLLLFTWIRNHGPEAFEAAAFPRVSQDLINNDTIRQDPSYDASRLTAESLQELFLHLLQEELADGAAQGDAVPADGSLSPNSRKRKRSGPAPQVTTLVEARQHVHRLPDAEAKLYAKYKQKVAEELWQEQEDMRRLEEEIARLELQEKQAAEARKSASAGPSAAASPVKEPSRPPSAVQTVATPKPAPQTNGTGAHPLPPAPVQATSSNNAPPPSRQISPARPSTTPVPLPPLVQPPTVASPGHFSPGVVGAQASPKPPHAPPPILQRPQGLPPSSPRPGQQPSSTPPAAEALQRPATGPKPRTPSQPLSPQLPVPGSLKWEPPYQPQPGSQPQRPPSSVSQFPPPRSPHHPQQWSPQPPLQYPHPQPLQPPPQVQMQSQGQPPARPIVVAPQPGGPGLTLQPAPVRSHSGSPVTLQRPVGAPSPLSGQARPSPSPYQHPQQVFPPPQTLPPPHNRIVPTVASTPPPIPPAGASQQQWPRPPAPTQTPPAGAQLGQPGVPMPPVSSMAQSATHNPPFSQGPRPAVPAHVLPQPQQVSTPGPGVRRPHPVLPQTPLTMPFYSRPQGSGTKWTSAHPTPSTPGPVMGEIQSPAFEPLSPVLQSASLSSSARRQSKPAEIDTSAAKKGTRVSRGALAGEGAPQRRTPSVASPHDDHSQMDVDVDSATKVKREDATPKPLEDAGDTTADESASGRRHFASPRNARPVGKRKRQDSATSEHRTTSESRSRLSLLVPAGIPTHVLWTRGFPRVSASALEQIQSHKYANMFQNKIRPKEAPGYDGIIHKAQFLRNIQKAISSGHKAAAAAAAALPDGDPGTSSVWLPISEDLVPPRAIINSAQLERELVHMFANAIMYNLDPNRGPGPAFMKGSGVGEKGANEAHGRVESHAAGDASNMIGYKVDENSVVRETQSMFAEVDKLLIELRSTEVQPGVPPAPLPPGAVPASERLARGSIADQGQTPAPGVGGSLAEDDGEEQHTDRENEGSGGTAKRRRLGRG